MLFLTWVKFKYNIGLLKLFDENAEIWPNIYGLFMIQVFQRPLKLVFVVFSLLWYESLRNKSQGCNAKKAGKPQPRSVWIRVPNEPWQRPYFLLEIMRQKVNGFLLSLGGTRVTSNSFSSFLLFSSKKECTDRETVVSFVENELLAKSRISRRKRERGEKKALKYGSDTSSRQSSVLKELFCELASAVREDCC